MSESSWYPVLCLKMAREYLDGGDCIVPRIQLAHYRTWRHGGLCEPTMDDGTKGDQFAHDLCVRLGHACLDEVPPLKK